MTRKSAKPKIGKEIVDTVKFPTNLSFCRSIDVGDGYFFSTSFDAPTNLTPVPILQRGISGSQSQTSLIKGKKNIKTENGVTTIIADEIHQGNCQLIDYAALPQEHDTLVVKYDMSVVSNSREPFGCSENSFTADLEKFTRYAHNAGVYRTLAQMYLWNIVNGRTLFRNNYGIVTTTLTVEKLVKSDGFVAATKRDAVTVEAVKFSLKKFDADAVDTYLGIIVDDFTEALTTEDVVLNIKVVSKVKLRSAATVWPSQEFVNNKSKGRGAILSSIQINWKGDIINQATFHSQKLGNAIRTVDTWANGKPIPAEPFGYHRMTGTAYRNQAMLKNGANIAELVEFSETDANHFYEYLKNLRSLNDALAADADSVHKNYISYVIAVLIRGGVFGISDKKEKEEGENGEPSPDEDEDAGE